MTVTNGNWWAYENLHSGEPYDWGDSAARGDSPWDNLDFHLDLGCGRLPKGRLGIDRFPAPEVGLMMDLDRMEAVSGYENDAEFGELSERTKDLFVLRDRELGKMCHLGLPFPDQSIESIISHHFMEHVGDGFIPLMDECHRVLKPGGVLRIIVPLFPSRTAVEDPDHKRYFMAGTFETFCGAENGSHWHESFSVPYTACRFEKVHQDITGRMETWEDEWGPEDARELRVALRKRDL